MDSITPLPDDLILRILSFPPTEVAITTSLLSKRWRDVWKHVPKLEYCDPDQSPRCSTFVDNYLLFHKAPVLKTMHVRLARYYPPEDIENWFIVAISRGVYALHFRHYQYSTAPLRLPLSLYTCTTLVTLHLIQTLIVDVPLIICIPSLKTLRLIRVDFSEDEALHRLLSGCPVLEDLTVVREKNGNVKAFTIMVPSLQRLAVWYFKSDYEVPGNDVGFVIKTPLKSLTVVNQVSWVCSLVNMPNLVKADIKLPPGDSKKLLGCLISAKHLSLCAIPSTFTYPIGVFYHLVSLELCTCCSVWFCLILGQTPKLRVLRFRPIHNCCHYSHTQWEQPSSVPQCLISSLETVEWFDYKGRDSEKKAMTYLLENSGQLKKMAIKASQSTSLEGRYKMLQELSSTQRSCKQCQLSFI